MPRVTKITEQKRHENRRNVFLDGRFAFGCNVTVIARFRLQPGLDLSAEQIREIENGEVKQECFDKALLYLSHRAHSRAEIFRKLKCGQWPDAIIDAVVDDLTRMNYLDDARLARARATASAKEKHHGRRRAFIDLIRSGINGDVADQALKEVYSETDPVAIAREFAMKYLSRRTTNDPQVTRRRLIASLQRRGFSYDQIRPVLQELLGARDENYDPNPSD